MADDIGFKVLAKIDGLQASMLQAAGSVKHFSDETKEHLEGIHGAFEKLSGIIAGFASVIAGGLIFKEVIEATEKWTDSVRDLSHQFGITTVEASGLAVALKTIGSNTEEYAASAAKLDRQVKSNEDKVNELGVATRNASGALYSQQQIMLNAIATLGTYKEGTDRNIASQYLFGRGAGDLQKLLRLTSDEIKLGSENAEKFGLVVSGEAADGGRTFQRAIALLDLSLKGLEYSLGERIIPALTKMATVFTTTVIPAINSAINAVKKFEQGFGEAIAIALAHNDPDLIKAIKDEANGVPYGKKQQEPKPEVTGTRTIDADFGKTEKRDEATKERIALAQLEVATNQQLGKVELQSYKDILEAKVAAGKISEQEEINSLKDLANQSYRIDLAALQQESQIDGLSVVEKQKTYDQIKILKAKHEQEINKLNLQGIQAQRQQYSELFNALNNGFKGVIQGVLQGTQTWRQAMQHLFTDILASFAGFLEEKAAKWVENQIFEMIFGKTTAQSEGLTVIGTHAAEAGAAAFASTAAIPIIGPALAPAASAAAYAGALAYGATIPAALKGYDIPHGVNPLTQLHEREMVLPEEHANTIRNMKGGGGGDIHLHVSAMDANSVRRLFMDSGEHIAASLKRQMRNANPTLANFKG